MRRISLKPLFNAPVLSGRLVIRKMNQRDVAAFQTAMMENNSEMESFFIMPKGIGSDQAKIKKFVLPRMDAFTRTHNLHYLGAFRAGNPQNMVGMAVCSYDRQNNVRVGYFIKPSERRSGYGSEMFKSLMDAVKGFTGQQRMYAEVQPHRNASLKMLMSLGLEPMGMRVGTINKNESRRMIALTKAL